MKWKEGGGGAGVSVSRFLAYTNGWIVAYPPTQEEKACGGKLKLSFAHLELELSIGYVGQYIEKTEGKGPQNTWGG